MSDGGGMRAFGENDGDLSHLDSRTIAFIGYGNQGRAQALNMRDSGVGDIVVGTLRDSSWTQAEADGFPVRSAAEAAEAADILFLLTPDEELPAVFDAEIAPHLQPNDMLVFASGYNLAYEGIAPPSTIDIALLAPRMIGRQLRLLYERGEGFYSYISVEQDASGSAWPVLLALAKGVGTLRLGAFELSARDETILDLYHEQGFGSLLGTTLYMMLEVGKEAGIPAEALVMDLYLSGEAAETMKTMAELGFVDQARLHSLTSQYGGMMRTMGMDREPIRKHLEAIVEDVKSGEFAKRWAAERESGYESFKQAQKLAGSANPFSPVEERIRAALREAQARGKSGSKRP